MFNVEMNKKMNVMLKVAFMIIAGQSNHSKC